MGDGDGDREQNSVRQDRLKLNWNDNDKDQSHRFSKEEMKNVQARGKLPLAVAAPKKSSELIFEEMKR